MFNLFKRKGTDTPPRQVDDQAVDEVTNAELWQQETRGAVPVDVASDLPNEPPPEYIEEAATPSEEDWEREEDRYRAKEEGEQPA